jgi:c-di-GMP-binding flagellar brake protein YcgR
MGKKFEERRKGTRAKRILSIRHRLHKRSDKKIQDEWHLSTTEDMSTSGLLFVTTTPYQINDIVEIHVIMSGVLDIFRGYGKIVRVEKKELGVVAMVGVKYLALKPIPRRRAKSFL